MDLFCSLPLDVLFMILQRVASEEGAALVVTRLARTARRFHALFSGEAVWARLVNDTWGALAISSSRSDAGGARTRDNMILTFEPTLTAAGGHGGTSCCESKRRFRALYTARLFDLLTLLQLSALPRNRRSFDDIFGYEATHEQPLLTEYSVVESALRGIYAFGLEKPSSFQQDAMAREITTGGASALLQGHPGTGKTCAMCILVPILMSIFNEKNGDNNDAQCIIVVPNDFVVSMWNSLLREFWYFYPRKIRTRLNDSVHVVTPDRLFGSRADGRPQQPSEIALLVLAVIESISRETFALLTAGAAHTRIHQVIACGLSVEPIHVARFHSLVLSQRPHNSDVFYRFLANDQPVFAANFCFHLEKHGEKLMHLQLLTSIVPHRSILVYCNSGSSRAELELAGYRVMDDDERSIGEFQSERIRLLVMCDDNDQSSSCCWELNFCRARHVVMWDVPTSAHLFAHMAARVGRYARQGHVHCLASGSAEDAARFQRYFEQFCIRDVETASIGRST